MHGFAHPVVSPKRKGHITHPTTDVGMGKVFAYPLGGLKKVKGVVFVFFHASGNWKNIGIENDVLWGEANLIYKSIV